MNNRLNFLEYFLSFFRKQIFSGKEIDLLFIASKNASVDVWRIISKSVESLKNLSAYRKHANNEFMVNLARKRNFNVLEYILSDCILSSLLTENSEQLAELFLTTNSTFYAQFNFECLNYANELEPSLDSQLIREEVVENIRKIKIF